MGDAYTAYNVGYEAIYYNPAGVALRQKPKFKVFDLEVTGSQALALAFKDVFTDLLNFQGLAASLGNKPGEPLVAGAAFLPQFIVKNFSIGALFRAQNEGIISSTTGDMDMYSFADVGAYAHYAAAFFGGIFKLGVGVKLIDRAEVDRTYTPAQYASVLSFPSQWNEGTALGLDAGVLLTLPISNLPTLGIAVQDVGNTTFRANKVLFADANAPNSAPNVMKQKVNVGLAMKIKHDRGIKSGLSIEAKDVLVARSQKPYRDRFHAGWELDVQKFFFLRAGVNQGRYWTAGLGVDFDGVGIEFATYGENISNTLGARVDDRKWVGRYVYQF